MNYYDYYPYYCSSPHVPAHEAQKIFLCLNRKIYGYGKLIICLRPAEGPPTAFT